MARNSSIRVRDLKSLDYSLHDPATRPHVLLKCFRCGAEYSATAGDYFLLPEDHVFKCCKVNLALVERQVTFAPVSTDLTTTRAPSSES